MPHVTVKMLPGRSEEVKQKLAAELSRTIAACVSVDPSDVSVSIMEVREEFWKEQVYMCVVADQESLYKAPKEM